MNKLLVVVAGPTASGKTSLAIQLATYFKTDIISADSRQCYIELSIGTAKPTLEELKKVHHHFINSHSVSENFNAGEFADRARELLTALFKVHDVLILAGGSGLYIDALLNGMDNLPDADEAVRQELNRMLVEEGIDKLRELLKEKDPDSWKKIDPMNSRRICRALEVTLVTGKPYSSFLGKKEEQFPWKWMMFGIEWPREILYQRINERTDAMINEGLKAEALEVIKFRDNNALRTVGYKEMFQHIDGLLSIEETTQLIAKNSRNYAKRQMTWFRRYPEMIWIQPGNINQAIERITSEIQK